MSSSAVQLDIVRAESSQRLLDLEKAEILERLRGSGAVLLQGFDFEDPDFSRLAERFSSRFFTHGKRDKTFDDYSIEVVPGQARVAPHQELGYLPFQPSYLWLLCRVPPERGGRTLVYDSAAFFDSLSPATQRLFRERRIAYHHRWWPKMWKGYWPDKSASEAVAELAEFEGIHVVEDCHPEVLRFDYVTSALRHDAEGRTLFLNSILNMHDVTRRGDPSATVMFEDGQPLPPELIDELEATAERVGNAINWQKRDVLVVDNSRALHAREAFEGARDVVVRIGLDEASPLP